MSKQDEALLAELGVTAAPEALPGYRRQRLGELGLTDAEHNPDAGWIPVTSSNVEAIRWVGGEYPLQVRFLAKSGRPATDYEYKVPREVYDDMFAAASKGKFVWRVLRHANYPYRGPL